MADPATDLDHGISADVLARARRRVRALRGFYLHATVYVIAMTAMIAMNLITPRHGNWFPFPMLGWGFGLAIHGLMTFGVGRWLGADWEEHKVAEILARERIRTLSTDKQLAEARLRLLQAQIEPHVLFNTLANVLSLIDSAPAQASRMLEHFIAYLRNSLAASRAEQGSVGQEAKLLEDYLAVMAIRMGERLQYAIRVEPGLESAQLAPMLVQPVVENAIRHGLEPRVEGGRIDVDIHRGGTADDRRLIIRVSDDGLGFRPEAHPTARSHPGSGVGLSNLRERLNVLHDGKARLTVESPVRDSGHGTAVTLDLPLMDA